MRQTQLSFARTTARTTADRKDTATKNSVHFDTSKEGQSRDNFVQTAGVKGRFCDEI